MQDNNMSSGYHMVPAQEMRSEDKMMQEEATEEEEVREAGIIVDDYGWLSTPKAAERLGITPRTLYRFINEGYLRAYKFGRVIRLQTKDVDEFIESCRIEPGTIAHLYPTAN